MNVVQGFNRLSEDNICCQLRRIRKMAEESLDDSGGLGILTSLPRDEWAEARIKLLEGKNTQGLSLTPWNNVPNNYTSLSLIFCIGLHLNLKQIYFKVDMISQIFRVSGQP